MSVSLYAISIRLLTETRHRVQVTFVKCMDWRAFIPYVSNPFERIRGAVN